MKKFGAILLIFCMVMSIAMIPVYGAVGATKQFTSSGTTLAGGGNVLEYDISDVAAGTYDVTWEFRSPLTNAETQITYDFLVDDVLELRGRNVSKSAYTSTVSAGTIYIPEGAQKLKLRNSGDATKGQIKFKNLIITCVSEDDTSSDVVFFGNNVTYTVVSGVTTNTLLTDYFDGVCGANEGNYTIPCDPKCDNYEEGKGYHRAFTGTVQPSGSWFRYDVSELAEGTYQVVASTTARIDAAAMLLLDEVEVTESVSLATEDSTDSNFGVGEHNLGNITITDASQYLKVKQTGGDDISAAFTITSLTFVPVESGEGGEGGEGGDDVIEASTEVSYTSDEAGETVINTLSDLDVAYVQVSLVRPDTANIGETIWVALYDGSQLKSVTYDPVTDANEYSTTIPVSDIDDCTAPMIKTFIWETGTYVPVIDIAGTTIQ